MIEDIISKGKLYAKVVRKGFGDKGINFITDKDSPLQFCILHHPSGYSIPAHAHKIRERRINLVQEVLYLESGMMMVHIYDNNGVQIQAVTLLPGDSIVLMRGGHGFQFLKKSRVIYTKQGPYFGREEDKALL